MNSVPNNYRIELGMGDSPPSRDGETPDYDDAPSADWREWDLLDAIDNDAAPCGDLLESAYEEIVALRIRCANLARELYQAQVSAVTGAMVAKAEAVQS